MSTPNAPINQPITITVNLAEGVLKKYTLLSSLPVGQGLGRISVLRCSAMLDNRMQCWRAGDFLVETLTPLTEEEIKAGGPAYSVTSYQLCRAHAQAEKDIEEAAALQAAQAEVTVAEKPLPKS